MVSPRPQKLGLGPIVLRGRHHTCDSRVCCGLKLGLCDELLAWGHRHVLDLEGREAGEASENPAHALAPSGPLSPTWDS